VHNLTVNTRFLLELSAQGCARHRHVTDQCADCCGAKWNTKQGSCQSSKVANLHEYHIASIFH